MEFCGDNMGALERWFSELDIRWVLHLTDEKIFILWCLQHLTLTWISALFEITKSITRCFDGWYSGHSQKNGPAYSDFVQFVEATILKMLPFGDAIVSLNLHTNAPSSEQQAVSSNRNGAVDKLRAMIDVREALSAASEEIVLWFSSPTYNVHSIKVTDEMRDLLSAEVGRLDEAIWHTMDGIAAGIMATGDRGNVESWKSPGGIHNVTRSVISYINLLWTNYDLVDRIARGKCKSATNLITEMVSSLEAKLATESRSFLGDDSLKFLFLTNNSYFVRQELDKIWFLFELTRKVDEHTESYLQVSWDPVLKCLHSPPLHCFRIRRYSPLDKFESKFQNTYAAQKFWKVPDPELRRSLRKAIIDKVTPSYTKFLQDNSINTPRITSHELEDMIQELFEG